MTTEQTSSREVPEGQSRKQILVNESVRQYLRDRSDEAGNTYSEQLKAWLPASWEDQVHEYPDDQIVNVKATPEVHHMVTSMTGSRVRPGDVVAFYAMLDAVEHDDIEVAAQFAEQVPDLLWDILDNTELSNE